MRILKTVLRIAAWIVAIPIALLTLLIGIWFFTPDEPLAAETQALLASRPAGPDAENAYFAVFGLQAAIDRDAHDTGRKIVAAYMAHVQTARTPDAPFAYETLLGDSDFRKRDKRAPCVDDTPNCLALYRAQWPALRAEIEASAPYLARYRALRSYARFIETVPPSMHAPIPAWGPVVHLSRLTDATIANEVAAAGTRQRALHELAAEMAFWKRLYTEADVLITKMIATSVLQQKLRLAGEIVAAHPELIAQHGTLWAGLTQPLPPGADEIRQPMQGEIRIGARTLLDMKALASSQQGESTLKDSLVNLAMRLGAYKPAASVNLYVSQMETGIRTLDAAIKPARESSQGTDHQQGNAQAANEADPFTLRAFLYNPAGRILAIISVPAFAEYSYRLRDLVAQSRLLEAQRRIVEAKVRPADVGAFLISQGSALANPHTSLPMDWNAATAELSFEPLSKNVKSRRLGAARIIVPEVPASGPSGRR
ncbi:MAG: hypothetical protein JNK75_14150 [Betaproteobacteria bacterium]|nr:hypothetical protein [Betaproteobacteria bacterium]